MPKEVDKAPPSQDEILKAFSAFFAKRSSLRRLYRSYQVGHKDYKVDFSKVDGAQDFIRLVKLRWQRKVLREFQEQPVEAALQNILRLESKFEQGDELAEEVQKLVKKDKEYAIQLIDLLQVMDLE